MERSPFLPLPEGMVIGQIEMAPTQLTVEVISTQPYAHCPGCGTLQTLFTGSHDERFATCPVEGAASCCDSACASLCASIAPLSEAPVRVLGIDDFAIRRGDSYGTILVNLETGKPLDLLADRTAEAVLPWLKRHQEIEVVSRDR